MRFAMDQKFWRRGHFAASAAISISILATVSVATAQQAVVRDLCSSAAWIPAVSAPAAIAPIPSPNSVAPTPAATASIPSPNSAAPIEIAKINRCVYPSPSGVVYNPELTAKVRRQYEDSLTYAKAVTREAVVSNVIFSVSVDVTTPPPIFYYREGDRNDGPTFISLTGGVTNNNPFPLSSVSIRCDYSDAFGIAQSFEFQIPYTLGPSGGHIPYQDKVINELPPQSVVNDISCKVETAEIWESTDTIQYLNAPLNPDLGQSAHLSRLQSGAIRR
jgi:hypothetical protein